MDRNLFSREDVQKVLSQWMVLRVDLTKSSEFTRAMQKRFQVIGPPTIVFFNRYGQALLEPKIVGEVSAEEFLTELPK